MCLKLNCPTSALDLCCFHNNAAMLSVTFHASSSLCLLPFLSLPHLIRQVPVYSLNFWSPPLSHHTCPSSSPNDVHPGYDNSLPEDGPASLSTLPQTAHYSSLNGTSLPRKQSPKSSVWQASLFRASHPPSSRRGSHHMGGCHAHTPARGPGIPALPLPASEGFCPCLANLPLPSKSIGHQLKFLVISCCVCCIMCEFPDFTAPRPRSPGSRLSKQSLPLPVLPLGRQTSPSTIRSSSLLVYSSYWSPETSYWLHSSPSLLFCSTCPTNQALVLFIFSF